MPAYDRPIQINVPEQYPGARRSKDSVAAVIRFTAGPNQLVRIQAWLDRAADAGIIEKTVAKEYSSAETCAELYFP